MSPPARLNPSHFCALSDRVFTDDLILPFPAICWQPLLSPLAKQFTIPKGRHSPWPVLSVGSVLCTQCDLLGPPSQERGGEYCEPENAHECGVPLLHVGLRSDSGGIIDAKACYE